MAFSERPASSDWDDLLRPTLSVDDDKTEMDRPWDPRMIVFASFFLGPIAGASLLAANARRLGQPSQFWPLLFGGLIFTVCVYLGIATLSLTLFADWEASARRNATRIPVRAATVLAGWLVSGSQRRRYRLAEATDTPVGSLLWSVGPAIALVAVVVEVLLAILLAMTMVLILQNLGFLDGWE